MSNQGSGMTQAIYNSTSDPHTHLTWASAIYPDCEQRQVSWVLHRHVDDVRANITLTLQATRSRSPPPTVLAHSNQSFLRVGNSGLRAIPRTCWLENKQIRFSDTVSRISTSIGLTWHLSVGSSDPPSVAGKVKVIVAKIAQWRGVPFQLHEGTRRFGTTRMCGKRISQTSVQECWLTHQLVAPRVSVSHQGTSWRLKAKIPIFLYLTGLIACQAFNPLGASRSTVSHLHSYPLRVPHDILGMAWFRISRVSAGWKTKGH